MKIEEVIEILENGGWWDLLIPITTIEGRSDEDKLHQAIDMAISALHSMPEAGEPLSLEQLKQMVGKPVWIEDKEYPENTGWVIWDDSFKQNWLGDPETQNSHGKSWLAYSYPPAHIDRSEWEPCEHCKPSEYPPDRWGAHEFPVVGNEIYFYDTEYGWEGEEIKYCPWCGRPLTEEAWAELKRRVRR